MRRHPPGFGAAWSALGAGALALIAFDLVQAHGVAAVPRAAPTAPSAPAVVLSSNAPAVVLPPAARQARSEQAATAPEASTSSGASAGSIPEPGATPGRSPSPGRSPLLGAALSVVVPLRGSTPVAVRVAVVAPAAPPFPTLATDLLPPLG